MAQKKHKKIAEEPVELIDGYYMPKSIVQPYLQLRNYCLEELDNTLKSFCDQVDWVHTQEDYYVQAISNEGSYKIPVTPQTVSLMEKAIGTKKLMDFIKEQQNG